MGRKQLSTRRTQFKSKRGAPIRNANAVKALAWENGFDLSDSVGIRSFLEEVVRAVWEGRLGTRAASSLNGSLRLMFELCELPQLEERVAELEKVKRH
jgi:hypothetical protein